MGEAKETKMKMAKFLPSLSLLLSVFVNSSIMSGELKNGWIPKEPGENLGDYGFGHHSLHGQGVVDGLTKHYKTSCCDGGKGGECRQTTIKYDRFGKQHVLLDGNWCPIPPEFLRRMEEASEKVPIPDDIEAIMCVRKPHDMKIWPYECPQVYYCGVKKPPDT